MQLVSFPGKVEIDPPADALHSPGTPFVQDLAHAHDLRVAGHEDVEITGEGVLQGRHAVELGHQLVRVRAAFEVDRKLQPAQIGLVAHVVDFADLAGFDQLGDLVDDGLGGRRIGDLIDLDDVFLRDEAPSGPHAEAAAAGGVDALHLAAVKDDLSAGGEIRRGHRQKEVMARIAQIVDRRLADLVEIEAAYHARHTDGDAVVGRYQYVRESRRKQGGFLHASVIVVDKVHGILVDIAEDFRTDRCKLRLGIAGGRAGHIAREDLAEVALGVHKGCKQCLIARGETHHRLVDRGVAVRVELHRLADDIGALRAGARQKPHLIHRIEQLAVRGLEAVYLRNRARDDHAHGIGHVIRLQRLGDRLLHDRGVQPHDIGVVVFLGLFFFLCHLISCSSSVFFLSSDFSGSAGNAWPKGRP